MRALRRPGVVVLALALLLWPVALPRPAAAADPDRVDHIARLLRTPDACGMSVYDCASFGDSIAVDMKTAIGQQLDQGRSQGQILDFFVERYGEEVLLSPQRKGFGLVAWVVPVAAGLAFALVLGLPLLRLAAGRRKQPSAPEDAEADRRYRERVEEDLRRLE